LELSNVVPSSIPPVKKPLPGTPHKTEIGVRFTRTLPTRRQIALPQNFRRKTSPVRVGAFPRRKTSAV
jgi:hypothetical protein